MGASPAVMRVVVAGVECSGSTFVYQVARGLGCAVHKTHDYAPWIVPTLVTYRDPRDMICSYAKRRFYDVWQSEGLEHALLAAHDRLFCFLMRQMVIEAYARNPYATLYRYEDFFIGNEQQLVMSIGSVLGLTIDVDIAAGLVRRFSLTENLKRARAISPDDVPVGARDNLHIHGGHITSGGRTGVWRELFTPAVCDVVKRDLGEWLMCWDYERGIDWEQDA